jgi:hypothetical protein
MKYEFFIRNPDIALLIPRDLSRHSSIPHSLIITISYDRWGNQTWYYQSQGCMLRQYLRAIALSYPTSKVIDCCLAQSRSNCFRTPSDARRNVPGSAPRCCITVYCMWTRRFWRYRLLRTGLADIRGTPWCFFRNASGHNSTTVLFQTNHSIFYPFLLQSCFRSTFILLRPSRFRILYLDRRLEFLPLGYSTWCWTASNTTKLHSFISQVRLLKYWSPCMDKWLYSERL